MKNRLLISILVALIGISYVNAQTNTYEYDANNRLTKVTYSNGVTVTYSYDALGNRLSKNVSVSATTYTVDVSASPSDDFGTVTGGGTFYSGTTVELKAIANSGYAFSEWSDGETDNPRSLTVTDNVSLTATFIIDHHGGTELAGDIVVDDVVDGKDLSAIVEAYLAENKATDATDLDSDGSLTIADITTLIGIKLKEESQIRHNGHYAVDLGLPSGTLWATCNVGAYSPEETGCYYAWGETTGSCEGKNYFTWMDYKYNHFDQNIDNSYFGYCLTKYCYDSEYGYNGYTDNLTVLEAEDDAATANWGGQWRMPTETECRELKKSEYTTWTPITINDVPGVLVTSLIEGYTDRSIFLPLTGMFDGRSVKNFGEYAEYWSSTLYHNPCNKAYGFLFYNNGKRGDNSRERGEYGLTIRPVVSKSAINQ